MHVYITIYTKNGLFNIFQLFNYNNDN